MSEKKKVPPSEPQTLDELLAAAKDGSIQTLTSLARIWRKINEKNKESPPPTVVTNKGKKGGTGPKNPIPGSKDIDHG